MSMKYTSKVQEIWPPLLDIVLIHRTIQLQGLALSGLLTDVGFCDRWFNCDGLRRSVEFFFSFFEFGIQTVTE